ncbi:MAG: aminoacetone oxidase family FAD-binding enzyme [Parasporobacterium sp.]|nr:aminoacetone oxidase family FAD-binding enzyme [Parasporobacterium sp.]
MYYDIIIVGGGASGLCTAIHAKTENNSILILDHNNIPGKKILSTGNGRCNLTNVNASVDLFGSNPEGLVPYMTSGDPLFYHEVIKQFDCHDTVNFFAENGLFCIDKNGYVYPRSEQASTVLEILRSRCEDLGIEIRTGHDVKTITKKKDALFVVDSMFECTNLVIATGGLAGANTGNDGSGYKMAQSFGHELVEPIPALCGIRCRDDFFKYLKGTRTDGKLAFKADNRDINVHGNIQFTDYGISGIPTFQISSIIGYMLSIGEQPVISIDFLPDIALVDLVKLLQNNYRLNHSDLKEIKPDERMLIGLLNKNVAMVILRQYAHVKDNSSVESMCVAIARLIKVFQVHPYELMAFENAQTTAGGIYTGDVNSRTMESMKIKGLFFTGEVLDVNGICGGYNLQWAFSTAAICGRALKARQALRL